MLPVSRQHECQMKRINGLQSIFETVNSLHSYNEKGRMETVYCEDNVYQHDVAHDSEMSPQTHENKRCTLSLLVTAELEVLASLQGQLRLVLARIAF